MIWGSASPRGGLMPEVAFLNHMAVTFVIVVVAMAGITVVRPQPEPFIFPTNAAVPPCSARVSDQQILLALLWSVLQDLLFDGIVNRRVLLLPGVIGGFALTPGLSLRPLIC